ncbi:Endopolyphosphatase [Linnemannia zychae]|nr:Endopolyphosphatase [Linnemannia zychae]
MVTTSLWHLPSPAIAQPDRQEPYDPEKSHLVGQFLHITDIHPDEFYMNGGSISTSCHRNTTDEDDDMRMRMMMRPGRTDGGYGGLYGSPYSICDSPFSLANATFDWIDRNLIGSLDFVVWTGDNARHDSDNERPRTQKEIEDLNKAIANKFLETFTPDKDDPFEQRIPIVPSIGNNDVYPHNIMEAGPNRILQHFSDIWSAFIPESQYHTFQHGGYYTSEVVPGKITVVALNTLYFFNQNAAVDGCDEEDEPGTDQMDWLEVELESLRRRKMTAYLTGHVPPARKSYSPTCFIRYTDIALRFQDVIVGHLFGHANIDHFFILSQAAIKDNDSFDAADAEEDFDEQEQEAQEQDAERPSRRPIQENKQSISQSWGSNASTSNSNSMSPPTSLSTASSRTRRRLAQEALSFDTADEDEHYAFHTLGLNSYLLELWEQYEDIPKKAKMSDFAIALVAPSVVPTYNPSLRVYNYQLAIEKPERPEESFQMMEEFSEQEEEQIEVVLAVTENGKKKKPKKPKKPRKPTRPANPPAVPPVTFGFPLNYTQYFVNLTQANFEAVANPTKRIEYQIEYKSREDYGLKDLSVSEWLGLARRIVKSEEMKRQYLAWMVVLTGTENDHF